MGEWKPFVSTEFADNGKSVVKVDRILTEMGRPFTNKYDEKWPRVYNSVKGGYYDVSYPWSKEEFRMNDFYFSEKPIGFANTYIIFNEENIGKKGFKLKSYDDLMNYRIASVRTYYYTEILKKLGADVQLVNTEKEAFELLVSGKADAMIALADVYHDIVAKSDKDTSHVKLADTSLEIKPMHVIFSRRLKHAPSIVRSFNEAYDRLLNNGTLVLE